MPTSNIRTTRRPAFLPLLLVALLLVACQASGEATSEAKHTRGNADEETSAPKQDEPFWPAESLDESLWTRRPTVRWAPLADPEFVSRTRRHEVRNLALQGEVPTDALAQLYRFERLVMLCLAEAEAVTPQALAHVCRSSSIRWVTLPRACEGNADAMLNALRPMRELEVLHLTSSTHSSEGLRQLAQFPNLRALRLDAPEAALDARAVAALTRLPQLRTVHLEGRHDLTDRDLERLVEMPRLERLHVGDPHRVTPESLSTLMSRDQPRVTSDHAAAPWELPAAPEDLPRTDSETLEYPRSGITIRNAKIHEVRNGVVVLNVGAQHGLKRDQSVSVYDARSGDFKALLTVIETQKERATARLKAPFHSVQLDANDLVRGASILSESTPRSDEQDGYKSDLRVELRILEQKLHAVREEKDALHRAADEFKVAYQKLRTHAQETESPTESMMHRTEALEAKIKEVTSRLNEVGQRYDTIAGRKRAIRGELRQQRESRESETSEAPQSTEPERKARVVAADNEVFVLNVGEQEGVKAGHRFSIFDAETGDLKAMAVVSQTMERKAVARPKLVARHVQINTGDLARRASIQRRPRNSEEDTSTRQSETNGSE